MGEGSLVLTDVVFLVEPTRSDDFFSLTPRHILSV